MSNEIKNAPSAEIEKTSYYNNGTMEVFDIVDDLGVANGNYTQSDLFYLGNTIKYIWRAGNKSIATMEDDLLKAEKYLREARERIARRRDKHGN